MTIILLKELLTAFEATYGPTCEVSMIHFDENSQERASGLNGVRYNHTSEELELIP